MSAVEGSMVSQLRKIVNIQQTREQRPTLDDGFVSFTFSSLPTSFLFVLSFRLSRFRSLPHSYFMYGINRSGRGLDFGQDLFVRSKLG